MKIREIMYSSVGGLSPPTSPKAGPAHSVRAVHTATTPAAAWSTISHLLTVMIITLPGGFYLSSPTIIGTSPWGPAVVISTVLLLPAVSLPSASMTTSWYM